MALPETIRFEQPAPGQGIQPEPGLVVEFPSREWIIYCPKCSKGAGLDGHTKTIHADQTITFSPSLICPQPGCGAHYHIEKSRIRYV